jgi:hypothetical protein
VLKFDALNDNVTLSGWKKQATLTKNYMLSSSVGGETLSNILGNNKRVGDVGAPNTINRLSNN